MYKSTILITFFGWFFTHIYADLYFSPFPLLPKYKQQSSEQDENNQLVIHHPSLLWEIKQNNYLFFDPLTKPTPSHPSLISTLQHPSLLWEIQKNQPTISDNSSINKSHQGTFQRLPTEFQKFADLSFLECGNHTLRPLPTYQNMVQTLL